MIEKPKRPKKISNQDNKQPQTIAELIRRYDLDNTKIYDFLDELVEHLKFENTQNESKINKIQGTILYEDETGTNVDVPLNENGKNYEEIEVFGYRSDRSLYAKIDTKKTYFTFEDIRWVNDNFYFYTKEYSINGNTLKVEYSKLMYTGSNGTNAMGDDPHTYITKVIGHNQK